MKRFTAFALIEVLIAAAILGIGIVAAALLANSMLIQQQGSNSIAIALNLHEQTCRLYQLGLNTSEIMEVLPETIRTIGPDNQSQYGLTLSVAPNPFAGITNESVTNTLVYPAGLMEGSSNIFRTNSLLVVRESIR